MKTGKFFAGAVAAAAVTLSTGVLAAQSEASLYGDFGLSLDYSDSKTTQSTFNVSNNNSNFGLKASTREAGITAFVVYERLLDNDVGGTTTEFARQAYLGLDSEDGTLTAGRAPTEYKLSGQNLDPFYNTSVANVTGGAGIVNGASYGLSGFTGDTVGTGFINNSIAYKSPVLWGLAANVALFIDEDGQHSDNDYAAGLEYNQGGLTAGMQLLNARSSQDTASTAANFTTAAGVAANALRAYADYGKETWGVGASYENINTTGPASTGPTQHYGFLSGWVAVTPGTRLAATLGHDEHTAFDGTGITVGMYQDLIKNLTAYAAIRYMDYRPNAGDSTVVAAMGFNYKFNIGLIRTRAEP